MGDPVNIKASVGTRFQKSEEEEGISPIKMCSVYRETQVKVASKELTQHQPEKQA